MRTSYRHHWLLYSVVEESAGDLAWKLDFQPHGCKRKAARPMPTIAITHRHPSRPYFSRFHIPITAGSTLACSTHSPLYCVSDGFQANCWACDVVVSIYSALFFSISQVWVVKLNQARSTASRKKTLAANGSHHGRRPLDTTTSRLTCFGFPLLLISMNQHGLTVPKHDTF